MAKQRAKLDKSKPYGQIFGIHEYGAVFEQGGKCFNGQGLEVGEGITEPDPAPKRVAAAGPAQTEPLDDDPDGPDDGPGVTREDLQLLHVSAIVKLVKEEGLEPITGPGSKAKNIDLLLAAAANG